MEITKRYSLTNMTQAEAEKRVNTVLHNQRSMMKYLSKAGIRFVNCHYDYLLALVFGIETRENVDTFVLARPAGKPEITLTVNKNNRSANFSKQFGHYVAYCCYNSYEYFHETLEKVLKPFYEVDKAIREKEHHTEKVEFFNAEEVFAKVFESFMVHMTKSTIDRERHFPMETCITALTAINTEVAKKNVLKPYNDKKAITI